MSPLGWVVITYLVTSSAGGIVRAGLNYRTTKRRDQAFASGAQIVLTDFLLPDKKIGPYQVTITDRRHARCDVLVNCAGIGVAERTIGKDAPHNLAEGYLSKPFDLSDLLTRVKRLIGDGTTAE